MAASEGKKRPVLSLTKYDRILVLLFLITLPLSNPWVRGDGVGYYAMARSLLIEHHLDFSKDWLAANTSFRMGHLAADGSIRSNQLHGHRPSQEPFLGWPRDSLVTFLDRHTRRCTFLRQLRRARRP